MKERQTLISSKIDPTDRLLTVVQVAEMCGCSDKTVRKWLEEGKLTYVILGGGKKKIGLVRIKESSVIKFWKAQERKMIP